MTNSSPRFDQNALGLMLGMPIGIGFFDSMPFTVAQSEPGTSSTPWILIIVAVLIVLLAGVAILRRLR